MLKTENIDGMFHVKHMLRNVKKLSNSKLLSIFALLN